MHNPAWKVNERKLGEELIKVDGEVKSKYAKLVSSQRTGRMGFITNLEVDSLSRSYATQHKHSTTKAKHPGINFTEAFIQEHLDAVNKHFPDLVPIWTIKVGMQPCLWVIPAPEFYYLVQLKKIMSDYGLGIEQLRNILNEKKNN